MRAVLQQLRAISPGQLPGHAASRIPRPHRWATLGPGQCSFQLPRQPHFESKDVLILDWLEGLTASYSGVLDRLAADHSDAPDQQLLGFVAYIVQDLERSGYRGCPFTNTLAELPDDAHPARALIQAHKQRQFARLTELCTRIWLDEPQEVAEELTLLMEGAQVVAQNKGLANPGERLTRMVQRRLQAVSSLCPQ